MGHRFSSMACGISCRSEAESTSPPASRTKRTDSSASSRKIEPRPDGSSKQNPRRISPAGARLTIGYAYFAQQLVLTRQQVPPPQQSAEREVAFAVPTNAKAATIINRYFIRFLR